MCSSLALRSEGARSRFRGRTAGDRAAGPGWHRPQAGTPCWMQCGLQEILPRSVIQRGPRLVLAWGPRPTCRSRLREVVNTVIAHRDRGSRASLIRRCGRRGVRALVTTWPGRHGPCCDVGLHAGLAWRSALRAVRGREWGPCWSVQDGREGHHGAHGWCLPKDYLPAPDGST